MLYGFYVYEYVFGVTVVADATMPLLIDRAAWLSVNVEPASS